MPLSQPVFPVLRRVGISCLAASFAALSAVHSTAFAQQNTLDLPPAPTAPDINSAGVAVTPQTELGEVRAMWVVRDTLTSPAKIRNAVQMAKRQGFNTLFVQVRGRGDAFYNSAYEPRSEELTDAPADFDPLQTAIDEGHKAGIEVHAWMNTFLVWSKVRQPYSSRHVVRQHPEWIARDSRGRFQFKPNDQSEGAFLDPTNPDVREYTKKVFLDVVSKYNVDGIHFDYVRFAGENYSFTSTAMTNFRAYLSEQLSKNDLAYADQMATKQNPRVYTVLFPTQWRAFRQKCVSDTVRSVSEEAHKIRPNLIVSAAVFPNYSVASRDKGQAWHDWLRDGFLDAACPMSYNRSTPLVASQIKDAVANSWGKPIIAGVGAWQMSAESAIAKAKVIRSLGAGGLNFFSYDGVTRNGRTEAYLSRVRSSLFTSRYAPPNWRRGAKPAVPVPTVTAPTQGSEKKENRGTGGEEAGNTDATGTR